MNLKPHSIHVEDGMPGVMVGERVEISPWSNLYGCELHDDVFVGPFVEIQRGVVIGRNTHIHSHTFVCEHVTIGADCFIGHGVMFTNDKNPRRGGERGSLETVVEDGVSIGSNATILPVRIGEGAQVGAGAVVVRDVPPGATVVGNPAKILLSSVIKWR